MGLGTVSRRRVARWALAFALSGPLVSEAQELRFADDFESGALLVPGGPWSDQYLPPGTQTQLSASPEAAHRGGLGLRLEETLTGSGTDGSAGHLKFRSDLPLTDLYMRSWFRVTQSNDDGFVVFAQAGPDTDVEVAFDPPTFQGSLGGFDSGGNSPRDRPAFTFELQRWYLVEMAATGLGTASGARRLWIDGEELAARAPVDWTTSTGSHELRVGAPFANYSWAGVLDFDDVRLSTRPQASRLQLSTEPGPWETGDCIPLRVQLQASDGAPAPAPYDLAVDLRSSLPLALSAGEACDRPEESIQISTGEEAAGFSARVTQPGEAVLEALHPDFLGARASVTVIAAPQDLLRFGCSSAPGGPVAALLVALAWCRSRRKGDGSRR